MLKRIVRDDKTEYITGMPIGQAQFPAPFKAGLEYSSPARGTWNIVHTGMLIPQTHQIFVCAYGCLRGVVLTAAEMNAMDRYSSIIIKEENVLNGGMEMLMIEGVADILKKLPYRPRAILIFISCQHFFLAYDQDLVYETLRARFPDVRFVDCYMIPTLRKSGVTPDQKMRIQMHRMLEKADQQDPKRINLIGSNLPLYENSELRKILADNGYTLTSLHDCETFDDYLDLAKASINLYYEPTVAMGAADMEERLSQKAVYMSFAMRPQDIEKVYEDLQMQLDLADMDLEELLDETEKKIEKTKALIGDTPITLDQSLTFRYMNFARMLLENGFNVDHIYGDMILPDDQEDFEWIKANYPQIMLDSVTRPEMRVSKRGREEKVLALGQKAAYFSGTNHFVNFVESGGYFGFRGLMAVMDLMVDAYVFEKDRKEIIQRKGYGCESCL